jgi:hypothetical protein
LGGESGLGRQDNFSFSKFYQVTWSKLAEVFFQTWTLAPEQLFISNFVLFMVD